MKRDKLKKFPNKLNFKTRSWSKTLPVKVTVKSCTVGIEVSISGDFTMEEVSPVRLAANTVRRRSECHQLYLHQS